MLLVWSAAAFEAGDNACVLACKHDRCAIAADECCDDVCGSVARLRRYSFSTAQFAVGHARLALASNYYARIRS